MLDHHLTSPLYEGQWPIIYHDATIEESRVHTSYYKVNRTEPRDDYKAVRQERKSLIYSRTGEEMEGRIYRFKEL